MEKKNYSYTARTLSAVNHKIAARPETAKNEAKQFIREYFAGLDIPEKYIAIAVEKTFESSSTQEELNVNAKNYLLKNIKRM